MKLFSLRAGRLGVELAPGAGGSIAGFTVAVEGEGPVDLLRRMTPEALASGRGNNAAAYPLVPFSNRIAEGRLDFGGEPILLRPNWPGQRHPMHGDGWARAWTVEQIPVGHTHGLPDRARPARLMSARDARGPEDHDSCSVERAPGRGDSQSAAIVYEHDGRDGWPFRYRARQTYRLTEDSLSVGMSLENLEARSVPAGLGLHPFFLRDADTELACRTGHVWLADAEVLPVERVAVPAGWDFATSRRVDDIVLDNCFEGWDGRATISWPRRKLRLDIEASAIFRHLVVYTPPGRPFFCVEPVSHANGALGTTRLAPGATMAGEIVLRVSTL